MESAYAFPREITIVKGCIMRTRWKLQRSLKRTVFARLHVVDLDGAASHHVVNYRVLEQIAVRTSLVIDFGGGVKSDEDLKIAFESGARWIPEEALQ